MSTEKRRTKRRYAHELYPQRGEWEVRPLEVEVPALYAYAAGMDPQGTGWFKAEGPEKVARIANMIQCQEIALAADAMLQGLTGQAAWEFVVKNLTDDGELFYERVVHYGVDPDKIKPYPCGPTPDHHDHLSEPDARGWQTVTRVDGTEDACPDCTEPVTEEAAK
ncbi:hypothetical protein GCM10023259_103830 [Thermocatellispora tengchongensis]|uniref:Uncharacterized protein n=1 Tax=Arthrobacter ginkgonis TaxID=1630594 RepID=A0ABP7DIS0_9MICC